MSKETYLGLKGYSILKSSLDLSNQIFIRDALTVRPYIPNSPVKADSFPVYRESPKKLYLPRYFGVEEFGEPKASKLVNYEPINVPFNGNLRDYQINISNIFMKNINSFGGGGLLEIPCGRGKTVIALHILSRVKTKTLVIVHKGFLLNQWIERIAQFLPTAKVGKIQGQIIDIEGKDIVIGMLQSLSMKEYPDTMFECFGLTIVDECHHISSEVFSRSLSRIVTKYTLGLSATMKRKDGLTPVFKMFLGEIIYSEKRENTDDVIVKAIEFRTDDNEFNEVKTDYRGNPAYSTMITKLCNYSFRSEYILDILENELKEYPEQQVMILAHNKALLVYLYKGILFRRIGSVGYYIGGMKDKDLKLSESKKIIIATYAMASEALDIKSLTTLILATPKTDITQAVGRILRIKHARPMVIDIVDSHDIFKRQWNKRRLFYQKNKYKILYTNDYNTKEWQIVEKRERGKGVKINKEDDLKYGLFKKSQCLIKL
tara:strand:+ start:3803 stop:5266 length:1464 start_codon:yes stop_codon:yes gene_type:complete